MPAVIAPSPIMATTRRSSPLRAAATAIPNAALIEVLECPTPKVSYSLSSRLGKGARPPGCLIVWSCSRRPVRTLCGIGLVADIPDQPVMWRIEHIVQGNRQLDRSQARREVPSSGADAVNEELA